MAFGRLLVIAQSFFADKHLLAAREDLPVQCLNVQIEVISALEPLLTFAAWERILCVFTFVAPQAGRLREFPFTHVARKRLLSSVASHVRIQVGALRETLLALVANVGFFASMNPHMDL